jgi:serpin B
MTKAGVSSASRRQLLLGAAALACWRLGGRRAMAASPPANGFDDVAALTDAYNASGRALFLQLAERPGNIVISPFSIGTAMAMALSAARGATEQELTKVLMHSLTRPQIEAASARALAKLKGYDPSSDPDFCPTGTHWSGEHCEGPPVDGECRLRLPPRDGKCLADPTRPFARLLVANAFMLNGGFEKNVSPDYVALVKDRYAAEIFRGATLHEINAWTREKTEGKIDKILDQPPAAGVLLNAIYFRAAWAETFAKFLTADRDFHVSAGDRVAAPMMRITGSFALLPGTGWRAIRLPFTVTDVAMIVVRPDAVDGVSDVAGRLDANGLEGLSKALAAARPRPIDLTLPKFKIAFGADLLDSFKQAGMNLALTDQADFSGMTGQTAGARISAILHRATIDVTEDGVEAAAATAVEFMATARAPTEKIEFEPFVVDRPFLFYIVDNATGAALFQGRIVDPTKSA